MNWLSKDFSKFQTQLLCTACMSSVSAWSKPVISPSGPHVVVPKRGKLELRCHDNSTASGPATRVRWLWEKTRRLEGGVEEDGVALVRVSSALPYHMGRYVCINNVTQEHSSIFVYVKGWFCEARGKRRRRQYELVLLWRKNQKSVQHTRFWSISFRLEGTVSAGHEMVCKRAERWGSFILK